MYVIMYTDSVGKLIMQIMIGVDDTCGALVQLGYYHHSILVIRPTL